MRHRLLHLTMLALASHTVRAAVPLVDAVQAKSYATANTLLAGGADVFDAAFP